MADAEAARGAGEAAVGDESHLVTHALTIERRRGRQHLAHAGAAARAFIADDEDLALLVVLRRDGLEAGLLVVETAGGAGEDQVLHARHLHDGAFGGEVALEADHAARHGKGVVGGADHVLVRVPFHAFHVLRHGAARHRQAVAMQEAVVQQRLHEKRDAAHFEQVLGHVTPAGLQVGDVGRLPEDLGHVEEVKFDTGLMRQGGQVKCGVCGTTRGRHHGGGILQRLASDDVTRADVPGDQFHHLFTRRVADGVTHLIGGRCSAGVGKCQADGLGHGRQGVGGELAAAGTSRRAGDPLDLGQVFVRHQAGGMLAHGLEHVLDGDLLAPEDAGQDRAAIDEHRRHVQAQHGHHHAGQRLVAAGKPHQPIIAVAAHGDLDRVRDHLTRDQRGLHALVAHGEAVRHGDGAEFARGAVGGGDTLLHRLGLAHQRDVAGGGLVPARGDADEGLADLLGGEAHGVIVGPVRCPLRAHADVAAGQFRLVEAGAGHGILVSRLATGLDSSPR